MFFPKFFWLAVSLEFDHMISRSWQLSSLIIWIFVLDFEDQNLTEPYVFNKLLVFA